MIIVVILFLLGLNFWFFKNIRNLNNKIDKYEMNIEILRKKEFETRNLCITLIDGFEKNHKLTEIIVKNTTNNSKYISKVAQTLSHKINSDQKLIKRVKLLLSKESKDSNKLLN